MNTSTRLLLGPHPDFPECRVYFSREAGFGWVEPKPTAGMLERFYRSDYRKVRREAPTPRYVAFMARRAEVQRRFIVQHGVLNRLGAMLDIGCGAGLLLKSFVGHARELAGFETDEVMARFAAKNLGAAAAIHRTHFEPQSAPDRQYDLITLSHVFEHITEPEEFLARLRSWLAPRGLVFIEVPHDPLPSVRHQVERGVRGLAHVCFFTPRALGAVANAAGFRVEKLATYGTPLRLTLRRTGGSANPFRKLAHAWTSYVRRKCDLGPALIPDLTSPLRTETPAEGQHIRALLRAPS